MYGRGCSSLLTVLLLVCLSVAVTTAQAEIYRYQDDKGATVFVDDPGKVPKKYRAKMTTQDESLLNLMAVPAARASKPVQPQVAASEPVVGPVELYVTSWCGYCKKMEQSLTEKGVQYLRYDIEKDEDAHRRYKEFGGAGVPLTSVGGKIVRGYNPDRVMQLLKQ